MSENDVYISGSTSLAHFTEIAVDLVVGGYLVACYLHYFLVSLQGSQAPASPGQEAKSN